MQTFQLIVFVLSAIALPWAAIALMRANMKAVGKTVLFVALAVAARYLLGPVWTPEDMWLQWVKLYVAIYAFYVIWMEMCAVYVWAARPWGAFVSFMALPVLAKFVFFGSFFGESWNLGSVVFWGVWTAWGLFRSAVIARKATRLGRVILAVVAIALLGFFLSPDVEPKVRAYAGELSDYLRQNVVERWEPIKQSTDKIVAAWDKLIDMDRRATAEDKVGAGKIKASVKIQRQISKLREDLLTVDSRAVLSRVSALDAKIASTKKALSSLREKQSLARSEKLDEKIGRTEAALTALEADRTNAVATVRRELKGIGLTLPENSSLLTVDLGALVDNAIVAKNIGFVVENLKKQVEAEKGDAEAAKRYYGAYIVMLDVQMECFRQYLAKAKTGLWRDGVSDVAKSAETAMKGNEAKAAAAGRTEEEKKAFLHAAKTNEKTLKAAQAYLAILKRHEEVVSERLAATGKRHEIALSFRESADIASSFGTRAVSDMTDFAAILELKLPEIALFDDVAMQNEFDAINKKLMEE